MRTGEAVIVENSGWIEKVLPPAIVGIFVFLFTKLWDALQLERKLADAIKTALTDFKENHVAPLAKRQSEFDKTIKDVQHDISEIKSTAAAIAAKLDVKVK